MKIRSHTGNMVDVRIKMSVLWKTDAHKDTSGTLEYEAEVESIDGEYLYLQGIGKVPAAECTMLSCPFMVGDEYEQRMADGSWFNIPEKITSDEEADTFNRKILTARHSNPDLRSKGEV